MRELIKRLVPKQCITCYKALRYGWITLLFHIFRVVPVKKDHIVFMNVWGFGDNALSVSKALWIKYKTLQLYFICNHPDAVAKHNPIKILKTHSVNSIYVLATSKVWVQNNRMEPYIKKRSSQYNIQRWHGGVELKKVEGECANHLGDD